MAVKDGLDLQALLFPAGDGREGGAPHVRHWLIRRPPVRVSGGQG
jgi:hypothetical protein